MTNRKENQAMKTLRIRLTVDRAVGFSVKLEAEPVPRARQSLRLPGKTASPRVRESRPLPDFHYLHVGPCAWRGESLVCSRPPASVYDLTMRSGQRLTLKTFKKP
jgi:hypothetical protein